MIPVIMPRQGQSVESCVITKWHKQPGDQVVPGDLLFSYETDKAAFEEEAKAEGTLLAILRQEGDDVPCLETVCLLGDAGEDVSQGPDRPEAVSLAGAAPVAPASPVASAPTGAQETPSTGAEARPAGGVSPRARALARRSGADLSQVHATGPQGRVIVRDVQALIDAGKIVTPAAYGVAPVGAVGTGLGGRVTLRDTAFPGQPSPGQPSPGQPSPDQPSPGRPQPAQALPPQAPPVPQADAPAPDSWDVPLSNIRKVIAAAMHESLSTMAQLTHTLSCDATNLLALREQCKAWGADYGMEGVTIGDLVAYAAVRTLTQPEHAALNAHFLGDAMRFFRDVHLGVAVDTPRGLMVPVVRDANRLTLLELSARIKALARACQSGAVDPDLLTGGSFTLSNLGAFGIEHFTPVINPPQTGILGVNTLIPRVRQREGQTEVYNSLSLSLTYDHRALDGAPASRFLRDLKRNLENIQMLLGGGAYHV